MIDFEHLTFIFLKLYFNFCFELVSLFVDVRDLLVDHREVSQFDVDGV